MNAKDRLAKHGMICFAIFFCFTLLMVFSPKIHLGFFGNIAFLISGTFFTTLGVTIGDGFRRFVMPDVFFASDSVDMFKKKLFWMVGPQFIGWIIGVIATNGFMGNVLGYRHLLA